MCNPLTLLSTPYCLLPTMASVFRSPTSGALWFRPLWLCPLWFCSLSSVALSSGTLSSISSAYSLITFPCSSHSLSAAT